MAVRTLAAIFYFMISTENSIQFLIQITFQSS